MRKTFLYKGFYLSACETKDWEAPWIGTVYHKKFDSLRYFTNSHYYKKLHIDFSEDTLILQMKREVDRFLEKWKKEVTWQIESKKKELEYLIEDLSLLVDGE